jgi:hypothetical protein
VKRVHEGKEVGVLRPNPCAASVVGPAGRVAAAEGAATDAVACVDAWGGETRRGGRTDRLKPRFGKRMRRTEPSEACANDDGVECLPLRLHCL